MLVIRRFVLMSALFASLGIAQFLTGDPLIDAIEIPGLTSRGSAELVGRGEFLRSSATATHPLEYAVVLSAAMPIALSLALSARNKRLVRRWWPTAAICLAAVLSVSRSAIVGIAIAMAVLLPALSRRVVMALSVAGAAGGLALYFTVPGLAGTIRGLFLGVASDPSTQSRTGSYEVALEFVGHGTALGRGFGTFLPKYQILDNQLLLLLVEVGVVGLVAFLAVAATGVVEAQRASRRATVPEDGLLMQALTAAIVSTLALFAFFDALSFPMAAGVFFLLVGISSAARPAMEHAAAHVAEPSPVQGEVPGTLPASDEHLVQVGSRHGGSPDPSCGTPVKGKPGCAPLPVPHLQHAAAHRSRRHTHPGHPASPQPDRPSVLRVP